MMYKNRKIIVAGLLIFCMICCCAFSYASYTSRISASGSVNAAGSFDVYFTSGSGSSTQFPTTETSLTGVSGKNVVVKGTASNDADTLTLNIKIPAEYDYSSDITFPVYIHNGGTVKAVVDVLSKDSITSSTLENKPFTLSCTKVNLDAGATGSVTVTLHKNEGSVGYGLSYGTYELVLVYTQDQLYTAPTPTHASHS